MPYLRQFILEEDGQDVVEYGLLIAVMALVVLTAVELFGTAISAWFRSLASRITTT